MADNNKPLASPDNPNQGSYDTYVQGLTTQNGQQQPSNPVADARAKLQAQQTGNGMGLVRKLFGFAGGTSEVPAPSFWDQPPGGRVVAPIAAPVAPAPINQGFWNAVGQASQRPYYGFPVPSAADVQRTVQPIVDPVAGAIAAARNDFAAGARSVNPNYGVLAAQPAPVVNGPGPQTSTVGSTAGKSVAPQPVVANPQPSMSPRTHTVDDFVRATEGMSWRQMAHLLPFAPPDPRNPQLQAQSLLNALTRTAVGINLQGQRPSSGLEQAIARAQNASGGGIGSLNPLIGAQLRRGMAAE